jgi:hypothetical protein
MTLPATGVNGLLDRRNPVAHQALHIAGDRDGAAGIADQLPLGVVDVVSAPSAFSALSFSSRPVAPAGVTPTWMVIRAPTSRAALKGGRTCSGDPPAAAR